MGSATVMTTVTSVSLGWAVTALELEALPRVEDEDDDYDDEPSFVVDRKGLYCQSEGQAAPNPPPPGVSMTNTSPGSTWIAAQAARFRRDPSARST
jgi:hypothetical protein